MYRVWDGTGEESRVTLQSSARLTATGLLQSTGGAGQLPRGQAPKQFPVARLVLRHSESQSDLLMMQ